MSGGDPFARALAAIETAAEKAGPVIVAIDGRCGSGKTTLAQMASERLGCPVAHMDEFYLLPDRRDPDWRHIPCANMDLERFRREVLAPFRAGERVQYRPCRCGDWQFGPTAVFPVGGLLVTEGSYCLHPALARYYDLKIFLTCSDAVQRRRLRQREGERIDGFLETWIPLEEAYYRQYGVDTHALCIDTSDA